MNYANGNIFEGLWVKGNKEGPGLFFYASTKKVYQGEWYEDQPQCGEFRMPTPEEELRLVRPLPKGIYYNEFSLPSLGLANPRQILDLAISEVRMNSLNKSFVRQSTPCSVINPRNMEAAKLKFQEFCRTEGGGGVDCDTISIYQSKPIFNELGLNVSVTDIDDIIEQLQIKDTVDISFAEVVEIATYIHSEKQQQQQQDF